MRDPCGGAGALFSRSDMVPFGPIVKDADLIATFDNESFFLFCFVFYFEGNGEKYVKNIELCILYFYSKSRINSHI